VNEFELIERCFRRAPRNADVRIGIGDDGAVIAPTPGMEYVVTVDMLVEGRHFAAGADPARLGHKTLAVNLSDLAAMGALPRFALLAGALPSADNGWVEAFMRGFDALAEQYDVELIGGDTTRGPRNLCVTAIGELPAGTALTRAGASAGDAVYVSGTLGDAALALAVAAGRARVGEADAARLRERLDVPEPRVALGVALRGIASAAIDVSDGLTGDLGHILDASRVGAALDLAAIPCHGALRAKLAGAERELALACLLAGGDDYELCFTAHPNSRESIADLAKMLGVPLTRIGQVKRGKGVSLWGPDGKPVKIDGRGYDHFSAA
jgi:thiamine-monophosphate kinase